MTSIDSRQGKKSQMNCYQRVIELPCTMGRILQIIAPKMKFFFIRAIIVNGIKDARNKSAHAKLTKYLLFVNRIGPREPNITTNAATFPNIARIKIIIDKILIIHSISVLFEEFIDEIFDEFRMVNNRQDETNIFP